MKLVKMVLGIPLSKLIPEIFKAVTKPMVNTLKRNVRKSPYWKDRVFIPMAQSYNKASVRVRLWSQGIHRNKEQVEKSARLSDEAALELGAEIVANSATFIVGLLAIIMQQSIVAATEKKKEKEEQLETKRIEENLIDLRRQVLDIGLSLQEMDARIRELTRTVVAMKGYGKKNNNSNQPPTVSLSVKS
uniref:Optic atrophy 3 protein homolog n=1 Tax=Ciona savignyi TaxID=51511 RepID=H2ZKZ1_CIOSA